jgi:hypothetical protein
MVFCDWWQYGMPFHLYMITASAIFLSPSGTGVHCTLQMNYRTEQGSYYLRSEWQPNKKESNTRTNCDWSSPKMQCREEAALKLSPKLFQRVYQHLKMIL